MEAQSKVTISGMERKRRAGAELSKVPVGTWFTALSPESGSASLYLRTSQGVVEVAKPQLTWSGNAFFEDYRPVNVEIRVEAA